MEWAGQSAAQGPCPREGLFCGFCIVFWEVRCIYDYTQIGKFHIYQTKQGRRKMELYILTIVVFINEFRNFSDPPPALKRNA